MNGFDLNFLIPDFSGLVAGNLDQIQSLSASIVLVLITMTILLSVFALIKYLRGLHKIRFFHGLIKDLAPDSFASQREDIRTQAEAHPQYGHLWCAYDDSLFYDLNQQYLQRTLSSGHWFNPQTLGMGLIDNRLLSAAPGWLTALGVVGTFSGLMLGLSGLEMQFDNEDQFISSILAMINGAAAAFITSLWGVVSSLLFNIFEKLLDRGIRKRVTRLVVAIDRLSSTVDAERSLVLSEQHLKNTHESLAGLGEQIGMRLQETIQESNQAFLEAVAQSLNNVLEPAIKSLIDNAQTAPQEQLKLLVEGFVEKIGEAGEKQSLAMKEISEEFKQSSKNHADQMLQVVEQMEAIQKAAAAQETVRQNALTAQHAQIVEQVGTFSELNKEQVSKTSDQLSSLCSSMEKILQSASISATSLADSCTGLDTVAQQITNGMEQVAKTLHDTASLIKEQNAALSRSDELLADYRSAQQSSADALNSSTITLTKTSSDLTTIIESSFDQFRDLPDRLAKQVMELENRQRKVLSDYGDQVTSQTKERLNVWNQQTMDVLNLLSKTIHALNEIVEELDIRPRVEHAAAS